MIVRDLIKYKVKGEPGEHSDSVIAERNVGIQGDRYAKGGSRQVAIIDNSILEQMEAKNAGQVFGICAARFKANIVTEGCDRQNFVNGDIIYVGNVVLKITESEKECFPDSCSIAAEGRVCPLKTGGIFAAVIKSGQIECGDEIRIMQEEQDI